MHPNREATRMRGAIRLRDDLTVILIAKAGSSSIREALAKANGHKMDRMHCDEVTTRAVSMWREPVERAWSAFKHCRRAGDGTTAGMVDPYVPAQESWSEFLAELADNFEDPRLIGLCVPQADFNRADVEHIRVPWDFDRMAEMIGVPAIPNRNPFPGEMPEITETMRSTLEWLYAEDMQIWSELQSSSN